MKKYIVKHKIVEIVIYEVEAESSEQAEELVEIENIRAANGEVAEHLYRVDIRRNLEKSTREAGLDIKEW